MGASILFPREPHWSVGSHAFWPIVDRIRDALPDPCRESLDPLFETAEVFHFIALGEDISSEAFRCFARAARSEYERCLRLPETDPFRDRYYPGIMACWAELMRLLEADHRSSPEGSRA